MVTVRQFGRGVSRTLRAMERDAKRAQRRGLLHEKAMARQALLDASANAAETYERLLDILTRCHRMTLSRIDWTAVANAPSPEDPPHDDFRERQAAGALAAYQPGWFARTFGLAEGRRKQLAAAVARAHSEDAEDHRAACEAAAQRRTEVEQARAVVNLRSQALLDAISAHANLDEAAIEAVNILAVDGRVIVVVDALELEDMPTQSVSLLQSGKASYKQLSAGRVLELHRDNICSSAVRIAAEFLRVLPIDAVEVIMQPDLLDRATGHITPQPVFYARITAQALATVNLQMADAAPLAERLGAHFDWSRKDGFRAISLEPFGLPLELLEEGTKDA